MLLPRGIGAARPMPKTSAFGRLPAHHFGRLAHLSRRQLSGTSLGSAGPLPRLSLSAPRVLSPPATARALSLWPFSSSSTPRPDSSSAAAAEATAITPDSPAAAAAPTIAATVPPTVPPSTPIDAAAAAASSTPPPPPPVTPPPPTAATTQSLDPLDNPDVAAILSEIANPAAAAAAAAGPVDPATVAAASPISVLDIPERLGYLRELGLDFGWGPTSLAQYVLEHVHVLSGWPWWLSIVVTAGLYRLATSYPLYRSQENGYRMAKLAADPQYALIHQKTQAMLWAGTGAGAAAGTAAAESSAEMQVLRKLGRQMRKEAGVSPAAGFAGLIIQAPLGYGMWRILKTMSELPVPGLENGGAGWLADLTTPDPFYLMPLANALMVYANFSVTNRHQSPDRMKQSAVMCKILMGVSFLFSCFMPGAVQVYFIASLGWNTIFTAIGASNPFRRLIGAPRLHAAHHTRGAVIPTTATTTTRAGRLAASPDQQVQYQPPKPPGGMVQNMVASVNQSLPWAKTKETRTRQVRAEREQKAAEDAEARSLSEKRQRHEARFGVKGFRG